MLHSFAPAAELGIAVGYPSTFRWDIGIPGGNLKATGGPGGHDSEVPTKRPRVPPRRRSGGPSISGVLLTPGASAGRDQPALVALDKSLSAAGYGVERIDFPYRLAGRRAPDRPPVLVETIRSGTETLATRLGVDTARLAIGGRSMGGRMCSMAAADGLPVAALVLVSYPLHPPGRPERARTEHFGALEVPCLFVSGTRDAFGSPDELTTATSAIPGPVTLRWVEGGDHGLRGKDSLVAGLVLDWIQEFAG